jgi:hypothetical protein
MLISTEGLASPAAFVSVAGVGLLSCCPADAGAKAENEISANHTRTNSRDAKVGGVKVVGAKVMGAA